jgi:hypothetical protein
MSLKHFEFTVKNTRTGETCCFLGQADNIQDAWKDGSKNCGEPFRPNSSGKKTSEHGVAVTLRDGRHVSRTLREFEGDIAFQDTPAP